MLAAAIRAAPEAPELKKLNLHNLPLSLASNDLRTLLKYYQVKDVKISLICGVDVDKDETQTLSFLDWLQVATAVSDVDAAKRSLNYLNNSEPLLLHILRFKAGQERFCKKVGSGTKQPYLAFLTQLFPEVPIESVPSSNDPLANLLEAWKYGDLAAVRAIQSDQLSHLDAWSIATRLPPLLIPEMGEWGEELLERLWMEVIESTRYCQEIDSTLLDLLLSRLE